MTEPFPRPQPEERFGDCQQSRFLQFGTEIQLVGDPESPEDFARAQHYLETITTHLLEFGPWWEKQPQDVVNELDYHNAWHQYEVEQERKAGEKQAEYRAVNLQQLRALSQRRVWALEENGWEVTQAYRVVCFFDKLIEEAVLEQEQLEQLLASLTPVPTGVLEVPADSAEDLAF
jgi:hypothetical protein